MVCTTPQELLNEMPSGIGEQFQGEWALYTCSMTSAALANIAILYPQNKELSIKFIGQIIDIAMSEEIREYDKLRWGGDTGIRQATLGRRPNGWYLWESEPHLIL